MANHTPPPGDPVPPGDPYAAPKVPPHDPVSGNPYASGPPPAGGMPPHQQGYPGQPGHPGPYPPAGPPLSPGDERTWSLVSHLSFFVLSVLGPLIVMLTMGKRSDLVRRQSVEALNFQLTMVIVMVVSIPLMFVIIGILTFFAAMVAGMVMSVIAAVQISNGVDYRYPLTLRMVT